MREVVNPRRPARRGRHALEVHLRQKPIHFPSADAKLAGLCHLGDGLQQISQALAAERSDPCLNPGALVDALVMPQIDAPAVYYRATDRYGDPVAGQAIIDRGDFDRARRNLVRPGCH